MLCSQQQLDENSPLGDLLGGVLDVPSCQIGEHWEPQHRRGGRGTSGDIWSSAKEGVEEMLCSVRGILWAEGLQPLGTSCLSTWPLCMLGGLRCWVWGISPGPKHLVAGGSPLCCAEELFKRTPNLLCHVSLLPQGQKALYTSGGCKRAETRASLSSQTWAGHEGPSVPVPSHCGVTILLVTILLLPLPRSHPPRGKEQPPVRLLH